MAGRGEWPCALTKPRHTDVNMTLWVAAAAMAATAGFALHAAASQQQGSHPQQPRPWIALHNVNQASSRPMFICELKTYPWLVDSITAV